MIKALQKYILTFGSLLITFLSVYLLGKKHATEKQLHKEIKERDLQLQENERIHKILKKTNDEVSRMDSDTIRNELYKRTNNTKE
jgi:hypothetical protein